MYRLLVMNTTGAMPILLACVSLAGCSSSLSRRQASKLIDARVKPHKIDKLNIVGSEAIPGFSLPESDEQPTEIFHINERKEYGSFSSLPGRSPDAETYLDDAMAKAGYVSVEENGPISVKGTFGNLAYQHSRTVRLTAKAGAMSNHGYSHDYSAGFSCYPAPDYRQCNTPQFVELTKSYSITGITQDQSHATVKLLIDWTLTPFGKDLQPYADQIDKAEEAKGIDSDYSRFRESYSWIHFLSSHPTKGSAPTEVLFQKFDDGWRIVDEKGRSERDYGSN